MIEKFLIPEIIFGQGVLGQVGVAVQRLAGNRVFLVSDSGVARAGWTDKVIEYLEKEKLFYTTCINVSPNPRDYEVEQGLELYIKDNCDIIVCIGGGSPMDLAKGVAILASNGGQINYYEGLDKAHNPLPPMVMLPSTSGTGSEVSQFSIIKNSSQMIKMSLIGKNLIPNIALIDPLIAVTGSSYLQACCGMDALTHAIEAYVSTGASTFTDVYALKSTQLVYSSLLRVIRDISDLEAVTMMSRASLFAGIAFSNALLGLVHGMSHQLGGLLDVPHGEANAILLPYVMEYNLPIVSNRYAQMALAWGIGIKGESDYVLAKRVIDSIRQLGQSTGIPTTLAKYPITEEEFWVMAGNTLKDPCVLTNPRQPTKEDVFRIFLQAYGKKSITKDCYQSEIIATPSEKVEKLTGVGTSKLNYYGQLKEKIRGLEEIIQEKKKIEDTVRKLNEELEQRVLERTAQLESANKELEAFSYSVSHDLRSPLRAIDGFSRLILEDYHDSLDDEGKRYLNIVRNNTKRMGQLIDDLLSFSRLGRKSVEKTEIDMDQVVREVFQELMDLETNRSLELSLELLTPIKGDYAMIKQVLVNLLSNAFKFTRHQAKPRIRIGCRSEVKEKTYYIQDNGVGFDMQYANKLFGVFQRLHSMEEFEGTGVGLAIVQRIIHRHGGRIWAEGEVNQGATFYFSLPIEEKEGGG